MSMKQNKLGMLLLSFVIGFGLWLYVITVVSPGSKDTFYNVPVQLQGESVLEDRGLIIVSDKNPTVTLELGGNRSDLIKLDRNNITVIADLSRIYDAGEHLLTYSIAYPGSVASNAIEERSRTPGMISLNVEKLIRKEIPVNVEYSGAVPEFCIADKVNAELNHKGVIVEGPASVISQITQAMITVDIEGRTESFSESYRYSLCDKDGNAVDAQLVRTNVAEVNLTLKIQHVKEIQLRVEVIDGGGATEETTTIILGVPSIKVAGSAAALETMADVLTVGTIDLGTQLRDTTIRYPLSLPPGITNLSDLTEIPVTIQFPTLLTTTFEVTNIQIVNVPEGMEVEMLTQKLTVRVRGLRELVESMTADDIIVVVDLAGSDMGTFTVKPTITLASQFAQIGALGNYTVSVTVRAPLEGLSNDPAGTDPAA